MKRRQFLSLYLTGSLVAILGQRAEAQQRSGRKVVGMITAFSEREMQPLRAALIGKLRELGWNEGQNLDFDLRLVDGKPQAFDEASASLVQRRPDLIVAQGSPATTAIQKYSGDIPVIFLLVADPVGSGLIQSLSRPGGKLTGFTNFEFSVAGKWVELAKQASPNIRRVVLIANPANPTSGAFSRQIELAARSIDLEASTIYVRNALEIEAAIRSASGLPQAVLITLPDFLPVIHRDLIIGLASELRIPTVHPFRIFPANGALMSYGLDFPELFRQVAAYIDRVLRGTSPSDLPVQAPNKFELVINTKTANSLGIELPAALLASADELIN